jgi:prepilin-type N-terminal cleavage/methylation domain-containing protein
MFTVKRAGFTLIELMVAVGIFAVASVMTLPLLLATSQHMDVEIKESDLQKRTTGRL